MNEKIVINPASENDIPAIVELCMIVERQHEKYWPLRWQLRPGLEKGWGGWLTRNVGNPDMLILAACDTQQQGQIVGTLVAEIEEEMPIYTYRMFGFIHDVAVLESHRGRGIGGKLLSLAKAWAAGRGVTQLRLMAAEQNPDAARLFARAGFRDTYREMVLPVNDDSH